MYPSSFKDIKTLLASRDSKTQIKAVQSLMSFLYQMKGKGWIKQLQALIAADLIEILCEAMSTMNVILIHKIFNCLGLLAKYPQFYEHYHTLYVMDSVIRSLHILTLRSEEAKTLYVGLQLISEIICRLGEHGIRLEGVCDVKQILQLVESLLEKPLYIEIVISTAELIINVLQNMTTEQDYLLKPVILRILPLLLKIKGTNENVLLIAEIVNLSMRFLATRKTEGGTSDDEDSTFYSYLQDTLFEILIPYILEVDLVTAGEGTATVLLRSILSFFYDPDLPAAIKISYFLTSMEFLPLLSLTESLTKDPDLFVVMRTLLREILICLSQNVLGGKQWRDILVDGFNVLPKGFIFWADVFIKAGSNAQISIVIFYYFYLLSSKQPKVSSTLLNGLCTYLISTKKKDFLKPFLKAFWFIFSVIHLSGNGKCLYLRKGVTILISLLSSFDMRSIYTHHPALLYWTFSGSFVPRQLQMNLLSLWLENDDDSSILELKSLALVNFTVCSTLIDLLCYSNSSFTMEQVLKVICLMSEGNTSLVSQLCEMAWGALPQMLANYCPNYNKKSSIENIVYILMLCSESIPEYLEPTILLRLSCLIPHAISQHHISVTSYLPIDATIENYSNIYRIVFNFMTVLLHLIASGNDTRGLSAILNHEQFLKLIESCIFSHEVSLCIDATKLLAFLVHCQTTHCIQSKAAVQLDTNYLMRMLCGNIHLTKSTLHLLISFLDALTPSNIPPLLTIKIPTTSQLRALYVYLHMICSKGTDDIAACCWKCLHQLLLFSKQLALQNHLTTLPFTQQLILLCQPNTKSWSEMMEFLSFWLGTLPSFNKRKLVVPTVQKTVAQIAKTILKHSNKNDEKVQAVIGQVLQLDYVPSYMKSVLTPNISQLEG